MNLEFDMTDFNRVMKQYLKVNARENAELINKKPRSLRLLQSIELSRLAEQRPAQRRPRKAVAISKESLGSLAMMATIKAIGGGKI